MPEVIRAHIVASGQHHDFDFVRLQLLQLLAGYDNVRTTCSSTYSAAKEIAEADLLITYTNNVVPVGDELNALKTLLAKGGRWLAMHGSAAIVRFSDGPPQEVFGIFLPGLVQTPNDAPEFMRMIGGRFIAHLPYQEYSIEVMRPSDPLVSGLGSTIKLTDEPYCMEVADDVEVLLESRYTGTAEAYEIAEWPDDNPRPQMWRRREGPGEIVYLAPGHRVGRFDLLDILPECPFTMEGPWTSPEYLEILKRCVAWGVGRGGAFASANSAAKA